MHATFPPSFYKGKISCKSIGWMLHFSDSHELLREILTTKHKEPFPLKGNMTSGPIIRREWVSNQETGQAESLVR